MDSDPSGVVMQRQKGRKHHESPSINLGDGTSNQWKPFQRARWGKMEKDKTLANLSGNGHVKTNV